MVCVPRRVSLSLGDWSRWRGRRDAELLVEWYKDVKVKRVMLLYPRTCRRRVVRVTMELENARQERKMCVCPPAATTRCLYARSLAQAGA